MRTTSLALLTAVAIIAGAAGCSDGTKAAGSPAKAGTTRSAAATTTSSGAPSTDADTKAVCSEVSEDIRTTMGKVAEAEAIGPPAGYAAVGAQYSAGAAAISAHTITVDGQAVKAAKDVGEAMSNIADKYVDSSSKPDKTPLTTAIDKFKAVCAGS